MSIIPELQGSSFRTALDNLVIGEIWVLCLWATCLVGFIWCCLGNWVWSGWDKWENTLLVPIIWEQMDKGRGVGKNHTALPLANVGVII